MSPDPRVIAHRGFGGAFPENTVGAALAAATHPRCDGVEIDLHATADGDPVVFHDTRLGQRNDGSPGLTDAEGVVWELPTETVTSAEVLDSGWTVPPFEDVLAALPDGTSLTVELKNPGTPNVRPGAHLTPTELDAAREHWVPFVERVTDSIAETDTDLDVRLASFCEAAVAVASEYDHETAPICVAANAETTLEFAVEHGCDGIHAGSDAIVGEYRGPTPAFDLVAASHDAGLEIAGWTAETWHDAQRFAEAGVDAITADYPSLLLATSTETA
ncbi:glycerophosphodiester phosphodiesterase [Natronomonas sp. CBA1123]|uniref:glycerophosphodiester phosphodiesterase n=1 Tax=Natronomonas sp. CBA1123 TaxID=2668070 RepID=UPI0012EA324C|nr:glycerophosphodiester phosphodiesterase [Natronomonas sp. CBA1123]MUV86991.1 glycerophosphodiester phosphodiesterase [Natronomonas sp. CBA1123]